MFKIIGRRTIHRNSERIMDSNDKGKGKGKGKGFHNPKLFFRNLNDIKLIKETNTISKETNQENTIETNTKEYINNTTIKQTTVKETTIKEIFIKETSEKQNSFCFVISSYNNENNIIKNLESVINQTYTKWRCIYTNDNSSDKTEEMFHNITKKYNIQDKFTYIKNEIQMRQAFCKYKSYQLLEDFEIVCLLDGDDWLADNSVLSKLNYYYNFYEVKIITSNYMIYHNGQYSLPYNITDESYYSDIDKSYSLVRYDNNYKFRHLKTGLGILFKSIPEEYFKLKNKWLDRCTDFAEMCCVSELSRGSFKQLTDVFYVYNKDNSLLYPTSYYRDKNTYIRNQIMTNIKLLDICEYKLPDIFIINLKLYTDKKINMSKQMSYISSSNYTFVEAVDGNTCDTLFDTYKSYFSDNQQFKIIQNKSTIYNNHKIHCTKPAIGLLKSIEKICLLLKNSDFEHCVILEDDIYTLKNFKDLLFINKKTLQNKDVVYLGCHNNRTRIYDDEIEHNIIFNHVNNKQFLIYGGYSMILSKKFLLFLIENDFVDFCLQANMSWDIYLNFIRTNHDFKFFIYFKQLFVPDVTKSGIQDIRGNDFYIDRNIDLKQYLL